MNNVSLKKFVDSKLKNKNGKLEGQRLSVNWFAIRGYSEELHFFKNNDILDRIRLYCFMNSASELCSCGNSKRFTGFNTGFKEYCESCSRSKNNHMKKTGNLDLELDDIIQHIKSGAKYNSTKIKQLSEKTIQAVKNRTNYLKDTAKISERLYHIEHNLTEYPKCNLCSGVNSNFKTSIIGYHNYCKSNCSYKYSSEIRKLGIKKRHYKLYKEKYKSTELYLKSMFSEEDYLEGRECIIKIKHLKCGHEYKHTVGYQGHFKCPKCYPVRSRIQYEIFDELSKYGEFRFNDRQHIQPKEIDILSHEHKFGIEYDSLSYHSTGPHAKSELNNFSEDKNLHLRKTELVEESGYQLFRIFSNEWVDKEDIWKSVIMSKLGCTNRIYARKCIIKELTSKEANDFIELNHLQGKCRASIRIGLFYEGELVSVMTFGKSRYNKSVQYELIRFCSKINTTVVGGASKLLKYFERSYNPESIISYANRRWSTGSIYEILGFSFSHCTTPNYFYFKGGDGSTLFSREQFQKHKLKDKLETFNPELTETENMYNNNYRKIYDCGNKVYIKY